MAHYIFNLVGGDESQATGLLRAGMWGVGAEEPHRDVLAPGDLALVDLAAPERKFIARAELGSAVHDWTPSEEQVYPIPPWCVAGSGRGMGPAGTDEHRAVADRSISGGTS